MKIRDGLIIPDEHETFDEEKMREPEETPVPETDPDKPLE